MDFLNDFSPMILANPKSHNLARGIPISAVSRTFSGLRSQCTMSLLWRYWSAVRIWKTDDKGQPVMLTQSLKNRHYWVEFHKH